jgi:hypothetical protein
MVTGQQVFELAMKLMDEVDDNGNVIEGEVLDYKGKTPSILTTLQAELLPNSQTPTIITDLSQPLALSDKACIMVLPYGLAAHLTITEDPTSAGYFNQRYEELRSKIPAQITPVIDSYDILSGLR